MSAIKVTQDYFGSSGRLYGSDGLGAVIRGLAIDHARTKIMTSDVPDLTDNSTGTAGASLVDQVVPTEFDATTANGADLTEFNAAIAKFEDAGKVLANSVTNARTILGLSAITALSGTAATADTIPALDQSVASASGTSAVDFAAGRLTMAQAKANLERLYRAVNEVLVAVGADKITSGLKTQGAAGENLPAITAATASADGSSALSKAEADDFLDDLADNIATIAANWNAAMDQGAATAAPLNVVAS